MRVSLRARRSATGLRAGGVISRAVVIVFAVVACGSRPSTGEGSSSTSGTSSSGGTTGNETSSSSEAGDDSDETDANFVPSNPDSPRDCDQFDHESCPPGEKCTAKAFMEGFPWPDTNVCVPIMGDKQQGEPCQVLAGYAASGLDDCGKGLICQYVDDDTLQGYCVEFCQGSFEDPECDEGYECPLFSDGVTTYCFPKCDPLDPESSCLSPEHDCLDFGKPYFYCYEYDSPSVYPEKCSGPCETGFTCENADQVPACEDDACCTPLCDLGQPETCPDQQLGMECVPYFEEGEAEGYDHLGVCMVPG